MYMEITLKAALFMLIGLFAIAPVVMNSSAVARSSAGRVVTHSAPASSVCNVLYPVPCTYVQPW
jgi:hypothetical protein